MKNHLLQFIFIVLFIFIASQLCLAQNSIGGEEYTVYSDLLKSLYTDDGTSQFAIGKTIRGESIEGNEYLIRRLSSVDRSLINDFNEKNDSPAKIENRFNLKSKINLIGDEINEIFKSLWSPDEFAEEKDWEEFHKKYQTSSIISLSRVGFNRKKDKALVLLSSSSGYLAGQGDYYYMVKQHNMWKVKKKIPAWIS